MPGYIGRPSWDNVNDTWAGSCTRMHMLHMHTQSSHSGPLLQFGQSPQWLRAPPTPSTGPRVSVPPGTPAGRCGTQPRKHGPGPAHVCLVCPLLAPRWPSRTPPSSCSRPVPDVRRQCAALHLRDRDRRQPDLRGQHMVGGLHRRRMPAQCKRRAVVRLQRGLRRGAVLDRLGVVRHLRPYVNSGGRGLSMFKSRAWGSMCPFFLTTCVSRTQWRNVRPMPSTRPAARAQPATLAT
jgi:hypothetical protein